MSTVGYITNEPMNENIFMRPHDIQQFIYSNDVDRIKETINESVCIEHAKEITKIKDSKIRTQERAKLLDTLNFIMECLQIM